MKNHKDLILFQKHFERFQHRYGVDGYKVYFKREDIGDAFADIAVLPRERVATARISDKKTNDIKSHARHEVLHLLVNRLGSLGRDRYATSDEIYEAEEELVRKLEELIPDDKRSRLSVTRVMY